MLFAFLWMTCASCSMFNANWSNGVSRSVQEQGMVMDKQTMNRFIRQIRVQPGNPESHYLLASYYQERGKHREAVTEFIKVLAIDPSYVKAYNGLGISYDRLGDYARAVESYQAALRLKPNLDYVSNNLCYSFILQGNHEAAIEACKKALLLNEKNSRILNNLGMAYAMAGNYDQAYRELEKAAHGDKVSAHLQLAAIFYEKALFQLSAKHYNLALLLNPSSDKARKGLEASQELIKITVAAERSHQKAEEAKVRQEEALTSTTSDDVRTTVARDDAKAVIHLQSAKKLYEKGDFKEAREQYRQAVALNPTQIEARKGLIAAQALARVEEEPSRKEMLVKTGAIQIKKVAVEKPLKNIGIEICNGNGKRYMARDFATYLKTRGFSVVRLTNADNFNYEGGGKIYYENDYKDAAVKVAAKIRQIKTLQTMDKLGRPQVKVKVLLGKDLIAHRQDYIN